MAKEQLLFSPDLGRVATLAQEIEKNENGDFIQNVGRIGELTQEIAETHAEKGFHISGWLIPNGWDYLAFWKPREIEEQQSLLAGGTGILRSSFHQFMDTIGLRSDYLPNFLQTDELKKGLTPKKILSRLNSFEIESVSVPTTNILRSASNPELLVVLTGFNFLQNSEIMSMDDMECEALTEVGLDDLQPADKQFLTDTLRLNSTFISPLQILERLEEARSGGFLIKNLPSKKYFLLTDTVENAGLHMGPIPMLIPHAGQYLSAPVDQAYQFFWSSFREHGWNVGGRLGQN